MVPLDPSAQGLETLWALLASPGILAVPVALGVGIGSALVGQMSKKGVELGFVPLGGLGMALFALPLGLAQPGVFEIEPGGIAPLGLENGRAERTTSQVQDSSDR